MFTPIRLRLSLSHLAVLLIGMGVAGVLVWFAIGNLYLSTQRENLLAQARLTAAALEGSPLPLEATTPYQQYSNTLPGIHTRLVGDQGVVLVDPVFTDDAAPIQVPPVENRDFVPTEELLQRPEIQQALEGQPETAVRHVPSAEGRRVLYAAAPVFKENGDIAGVVYLATPLPPSGLPANLIWQFAAALLVAAFLAGLIGVFLARGIARPLESLDRAAAAVSTGDLDQQVPVASKIRELDNLGQAFNEMTASLSQSDQAKNAFIADVTHELRTPLTVIKGTVETLEDGAIDDQEGRGGLLSAMQRETDRLIRLVNDLLVLTRADAGALNLDLRPLDLAELARTRCEYLTPLANNRQVKLEVVSEGTDTPQGYLVLGDTDRLAQVFDNLLDNAIRHAVPKSTVTVTIQRTGDEIRTKVEDQGHGISPEHLTHIFDRFYRVEAARDRQTGGSGLGLAIVRSLLSAQDGRITADSSLGQGTTFTFWLPAAQN